MTPPDSGEREVCGVNWNPDLGPHYPCTLLARHEGRHEYIAVAAMAVLPLPLAQRILAALEDAQSLQERFAVADELRQRLPK